MKPLDYIRKAASHTLTADVAKPFRIDIVTNFIDDQLVKILTGVLLEAQIVPTIRAWPYKQYHLELEKERRGDDLPDATFFFFDAHPYLASEFRDRLHGDRVIEGIRRYATLSKGIVVVNTLPVASRSAYANWHQEGAHDSAVKSWNESLTQLASEIPNLLVCDTSRIIARMGEDRARDHRGLYAFDVPFQGEFFVELTREWTAYLLAKLGRSRKCIVLDLDNTLWGGVVGELGPHGIALGPGYPGLAFVGFQQALKEYYERGIILAINSRNNLADVMEVFEKNQNMVLKPEHFAAIVANWNDKATNISALALELNIGIDSMVFLDDDPLNRDLARTMHPDLLVPEFSLRPEEYVRALYDLPVFHQLSFTKEDREKGKMYAEEGQRKAIKSRVGSLEEYIRDLDIRIAISLNDTEQIGRISQLTQKTNQFNLTTRRYTEGEIEGMMKKGLVFSGEVFDRFGAYGATILGIVDLSNEFPRLDTFLMSCRVMGRGVEFAFLSKLFALLHERGYRDITAEFMPTKKNDPAKSFLSDAGFALKGDGTYARSTTPLATPGVDAIQVTL